MQEMYRTWSLEKNFAFGYWFSFQKRDQASGFYGCKDTFGNMQATVAEIQKDGST